MEKTCPEVSEVVQQLKHILIHDLQINVAADQIPDDYSLLEDGLSLDSILIEELIVRIENRFALQLDDRVLDTNLFGNLSALGAFVARERATPRNPRA